MSNTDPKTLRWVSNATEWTRMRSPYLMRLIKGEPMPTATMTLEELEERGYVGLYERLN